MVRGERWAALVPALDGRRGVAELAAAIGLAPFEVEGAIALLDGQGLLADADGAVPAGRSTPPARTARVGKRPFAVVPLGERAEALAAALDGLEVRAAGEGAGSLVLVEDYLSAELAAWDAEARSSRRWWLPAAVVGDSLWLGPSFGGDAPACYACLAVDLARSLPVVALWHRLGGTALAPAASTWSLAEVTSYLAAALDDRAAPWRDQLLAIDLSTGTLRAHATRRYRTCAVCGDGADASCEPLRLESRPVAFAADGGWRCLEPAVLGKRLAPFLSPLTGWVRDLEPQLLPPELATHVALATFAYPVQFQSFEDLGRRPQAAAAGKGLTAAQAEVGAVAETIERHCGVFRGDEPRCLATQAELGAEAVAPNLVQLFSARQLARPAGDGDGRNAPLSAFDPAEPIEWTALWSLSAAARRYLPTTLCYHAYRGPGWSSPADSNGCAAGANREEAILQGLLELVERDHVAIWWYQRLPRPAFAVSERLAATLARAAAAHRRAGRELALLDLTADLGVPVAAAVSGSSNGDLLLGFGAHLDPDLAAGRALAELHQFWPLSSGEPPGAREARTGFRGSRRGREPSDRPWLAADPEARRAAPLPGPSTDLRDAIEHLVVRLAARGIEVLVLDQTRDGSPLDVVRVVAPGLRPWWRRLAPGRLYDVPVELGWAAAPRGEPDLNPDPLEA